MKINKKNLILSGLAVTLATTVFFAGTYSFLYSETEKDVVNNFEKGNLLVGLNETTGDQYTIIPGETDEKDPTVTVDNNVDAYVFVEVKDNTQGLVNYVIDDGWTALDEDKYQGVYYRVVPANDTQQEFSVLKDDQVSYSSSLDDTSDKTGLTLSFSAYAVQKKGFDNAVEAYLSKPITVSTATELKNAINAGHTQIITDEAIDMYSLSGVTISKDTTITLKGDLTNGYNTLNSNNSSIITNYKKITIDENTTLSIKYAKNAKKYARVYEIDDDIKNKGINTMLAFHINNGGKLIIGASEDTYFSSEDDYKFIWPNE